MPEKCRFTSPGMECVVVFLLFVVVFQKFNQMEYSPTQNTQTSISLLSDWNLRRIVVVTARILDIHLFIFFLVALKLTMY